MRAAVRRSLAGWERTSAESYRSRAGAGSATAGAIAGAIAAAFRDHETRTDWRSIETSTVPATSVRKVFAEWLRRRAIVPGLGWP